MDQESCHSFSCLKIKTTAVCETKCINKSKDQSQHMFSLLVYFTRQTQAKLKSINRQHHIQTIFFRPGFDVEMSV